MGTMSPAEQRIAQQELTKLLPQIAQAARETADGFEASAGLCR
jgi:hypothetical protein